MHRYNTFGSRFLAAIIDGLLFSFVSQVINNLFGPHFTRSVPGILVYNGVFYSYSIFLHYKFGQTLGKKITNVKVVSYADETKLIGLLNSFKRDSVGIALVIIGILLTNADLVNQNSGVFLLLFSNISWGVAELVTMLFNNKRRAIHDFLANSVVVDVKNYSKGS